MSRGEKSELRSAIIVGTVFAIFLAFIVLVALYQHAQGRAP